MISLVFFPAAIVGGALGNLLGNLLVLATYFTTDWFRDAVSLILPSILGGFAGGYFAAYLFVKLSKEVVFPFAILLPASGFIFVHTTLLASAFAGEFDFSVIYFIANLICLITYCAVVAEQDKESDLARRFSNFL